MNQAGIDSAERITRKWHYLLAADGVYLSATSPWPTVSSYLTRFTFSLPEGKVVSFLWHFPYGFPRLPLATVLSYAARTFLLACAKRSPNKLPYISITKTAPLWRRPPGRGDKT